MSVTLNNDNTGLSRPDLPLDERFDVLLHWCEWFLLWEPRKAGFAAAHHKFSEVVREARETAWASNTGTERQQ